MAPCTVPRAPQTSPLCNFITGRVQYPVGCQVLDGRCELLGSDANQHQPTAFQRVRNDMLRGTSVTEPQRYRAHSYTRDSDAQSADCIAGNVRLQKYAAHARQADVPRTV